MKNSISKYLKTSVLFYVFISNFVLSSEFKYSGPKLNLNYSGPIIVQNSHFKYTASDRLTFYTEDYLKQNLPHLLPLKEAIDTWAAIQNIHPRVLSELLNNYFKNKVIDDSIENKQIVFEISAGLNQSFNKEKTTLTASSAVFAVAQAYGFELNLGNKFTNSRETPVHDYFSGSSGPPLYSYFQPPWPRGEFWSGGGVHSNTGGGSSPRNSLDFFESYISWGGDTSHIWVSASNSGIARVFSECSIQIIHPNGWVSSYYHLEGIIISDMDSVFSNQKLSNYADDLDTATCQGGSSTGPHVHYSIYYDSDAIEIDLPNVDFTSWKHKAGIGQYDGNCANSIYTIIPGNNNVCPYALQLPNNTGDDAIFANGFE